MTHWKDIKKIDAHIHLLPEEVHQANPDSDDEFSYAVQGRHIDLMDRYNIEKSILMTFNDPYLMSIDFTLDAVHKNIIGMCEKYPGRYYAFADLDPGISPEENCSKLNELFPNEWFKGIKIHPNNTGINIDDEYNDPIFDLAEELGVPIAIHSYPSSDKKHDPADFCSPKRISNIMNRHRNVKVVICHMGGFQWEDCLDMDAYFDLSCILPDYVKEYGTEQTRKLLHRFDMDRIFFATDWPCSRSLDPGEIYERYFDLLDDLRLSECEINKIAIQNIKDFLGL
ncbi:MAG: amidohydrolase family protein [Erysipelotrichaceae bacterium]|nr:amidohydrolase family protein [Erysipelotrichaceae bacterium]